MRWPKRGFAPKARVTRLRSAASGRLLDALDKSL